MGKYQKLVVNEHDALQDLFRLFNDVSNPVQLIESRLGEARRNIEKELSNAKLDARSFEANESAIKHWTDSLERFQACHRIIKSLSNLLGTKENPIAIIEPTEEWAVFVRSSAFQQEESNIWNDIASECVDCFDTIKNMGCAIDPLDKDELGRMEHFSRHTDQTDAPVLPLMVSQLKANEVLICAGSTVTAYVTTIKAESETTLDLYIRLANQDPEERHSSIRSHLDEPLLWPEQLVNRFLIISNF